MLTLFGSAMLTMFGSAMLTMLGSAMPTVSGSAMLTAFCLGYAGCMARRCRPCAVIPPLTLGAGSASTQIPGPSVYTMPAASLLASPDETRCPAGAPNSTRTVVVAEGPALPGPPPPTT